MFTMSYPRFSGRAIALMVLILLFPGTSRAELPDSLRRGLDSIPASPARVDLLNAASWQLRHNDPETALRYARDARRLADSLSYEAGLGWAYRNTGVIEYVRGNYAEAIAANINGLRIFERLDDSEGIASSYNNLGVVHWQLGNLDKAKTYFTDALALNPSPYLTGTTNANLGLIFTERGQYADALRHTRKALEMHTEQGELLGASTSLNNIGWIHELQGRYQDALIQYQRSLAIREQLGDRRRIASVCLSIGSVMRQMGRYAESLAYFSRALGLSRSIGEKKQVEDALAGMAETHAAMGDFEQAYQYHRQSVAVKDSLLDESKARELAKAEASFRLERAEREVELLKRTNNLQATITYAAIGVTVLVIVFLVISVIGYRSKARIYRELQNTQQQLVVQGKLASLGQLTAGIAHELRNPLNFIKNFSEVSKELLVELDQSRDEPEQYQQVYGELMQSVTKIHEHGNRADSIVSGMMLHARSSSEERQSADVNTLLGYVLDLTEHSTKAMQIAMKPVFETHFDAELPPVDVVPQDLSQVFLNIINNAIDAIGERCRSGGEEGYTPRISITTAVKNRSVVIRLRDNGSGIPEQVRQRIFEPFFTTKDAGKGTGLGLSISYDIIVQKYGGRMDVESEQNAYTEFIITLPAA